MKNRTCHSIMGIIVAKTNIHNCTNYLRKSKYGIFRRRTCTSKSLGPGD